jgi:hypothetical protein
VVLGRSPYRAGSLLTVATKIAKHKLDFVGVQELNQHAIIQ